MPKYYVRDGSFRCIVIAENENEACVKCSNLSKSIAVNGCYWVSEKGFTPSTESQKVFSNDIIKYILHKGEENE
jgi:hypothetical protein